MTNDACGTSNTHATRGPRTSNNTTRHAAQPAARTTTTDAPHDQLHDPSNTDGRTYITCALNWYVPFVSSMVWRASYRFLFLYYFFFVSSPPCSICYVSCRVVSCRVVWRVVSCVVACGVSWRVVLRVVSRQCRAGALVGVFVLIQIQRHLKVG
jgi:hypothetical protein